MLTRSLVINKEKVVDYNVLTLHFAPGPQEFEKEFTTQYYKRFYPHLRLCHFYGLAFYLGWGLLDRVLFPEFSNQFILIRLSVSLVFVFGYFLSKYEWYMLKCQYVSAFYVVLTGAGFIHMAAVTPAPAAWFHFMGLIMCPIFGYTFIRERVIGATCAGWLLFALYLWAIVPTKSYDEKFIIITFFSLALINILGMIICYTIDLAARNDFILHYLVDRERHKTEAANEELKQANRRLEEISYVDGLTQIANRRFFNERLETDYKRAARSGLPLTLIMMDIDHFKRYNDCYGHLEGDHCLKLVAKIIRSNCKRANDFPARYGGEEFAIILFNEGVDSAEFICASIRKDLEELAITHEQSLTANYVTLSMGVASIIPDSCESCSNIIKAADQALYEAKSCGRDCMKVNLTIH